jgi:anaerobic selenocysteine-containing dehydrogenase
MATPIQPTMPTFCCQPAGWGEKHGTVTNTERCITRVMPAVQAPGEAHHDWEIVVDFARRLGKKLDHAGSLIAFSHMPMPNRFSMNTVPAPVVATSISAA